MKFFNKDDLEKHFTYVFYSFKNIEHDKLNIDDVTREYDGLNFLNSGEVNSKLISSFKNIMPMTCQYLTKGKFFYAIEKSEIPVMDDITQFGIIINDVVYYIKYNPYHDRGLEEVAFIPQEILDSWLYLSSRWCSAESIVPNIYKSNLPSLLLMPLHSIIEGFEDSHGVALPEYTEFLEQKFHHAFRQSYDDDKFNDGEKYFELRCLLDTRANDDWSKTGYQLFVSSHNDERNVYVIPRADVMGIKKLTNPAEVIDRYAAHLFSRAEGEFDFMQYAEDF